MFDVIVMAGANKPSELTTAMNVTNKAFINIGDRPMLAYVLQTLQNTHMVERIVVVGPEEELAPFIEEFGIVAVPEGKSIPENLARGMAALETTRHFLVASSDIPFLTPEAVLDFLEACKPYNFDVYYPFVSKEDSERRFPGVTRTYVSLKDGFFTGGNIFLASPGGIKTALPELERFFSIRKSPVKLAATLGVGFLLKMLTKRLAVSELETRFSTLFGLKGKGVRSSYAEIGTDVDKLSDLELAVRELTSGKD
jgi:GTP:adenosylcobinamide-phosphate guanylyltransferase